MKRIKISEKQYNKLVRISEAADVDQIAQAITKAEKGGIDLKPTADSKGNQVKWTPEQIQQMKDNGYTNILDKYPTYVPELVSNPSNTYFDLDLIDVLVQIEKKSGLDLRVTAGNDKYHSGKNSKHKTGNAVDFTTSSLDSSDKVIKKIEKAVFNIAKKNPRLSFINEYKRGTGGTGGHFHISLSDNGELNYYHFILDPRKKTEEHKKGTSPLEFNSKETKLRDIYPNLIQKIKTSLGVDGKKDGKKDGEETEEKTTTKATTEPTTKPTTEPTTKPTTNSGTNITGALAKVGFSSADKEVSYELINPKKVVKKKGGKVIATYVKESVLDKSALFESAYNFDIEKSILENWSWVKDDGTKKPFSKKLNKQFDSAIAQVSQQPPKQEKPKQEVPKQEEPKQEEPEQQSAAEKNIYQKLKSNPTPEFIAKTIKDSDNIFNDDEAIAQAAFEAIKDVEVYSKVTEKLGEDVYDYIEGFMNPSYGDYIDTKRGKSIDDHLMQLFGNMNKYKIHKLERNEV